IRQPACIPAAPPCTPPRRRTYASPHSTTCHSTSPRSAQLRSANPKRSSQQQLQRRPLLYGQLPPITSTVILINSPQTSVEFAAPNPALPNCTVGRRLRPRAHMATGGGRPGDLSKREY
uniref:Uncharacterized protein n=1 Tax=Aegilops tauschii subsp. strangulata TaxID=200361 RepID=A0A453SWB1_AEGTS